MAAFSAKFRSKYEVFQFLTIEAGAVLPPSECVTIYFLKDIVTGKKKCKYHTLNLTLIVDITENDIKNINVPMYKGLTIENMLSMREDYPIISEYMPDDRDFARLPRAWIANVIYTLVGERFKTIVANQIKARNEQLAEKKDLYISMDPNIARAFTNSSMISSKSLTINIILFYFILI